MDGSMIELMGTIPNPHDGFFKAVFQDLKKAREFFTLFLPASLVEAMDMEKLELESGSFIDSDLRQSQSDLLFRSALKEGGSLWLYLLFEHQSGMDQDMPLRFTRYIVRIWEQYQRENPHEHRLPTITPILLYHGSEAWTAPRRLSESLQVRGDWNIALPELEYVLIDLHRIPEEHIRADIELLLALTLFRHIRSPHFPEVFSKVAELFRILKQKRTGLEYIETILAYIFRVRGQEELHDAVEIIKQNAIFTEEDPMGTIAEYFIEQGERRGEQRGSASAFQEVLIEMLEEQFDIVPSKITRQVRSITDPDLLRILRRKLRKCEAPSDFEALLERAKLQD